MSEPDYYQLLGVAPGAGTSEIRRAWRQRVRDVHPDAGGDPAEFHLLQQALGVLTDPQKRMEYDTARTGRRPVWLPSGRGGRHSRGRRVRGWRVDDRAPSPAKETRGDMLRRPWYADVKQTRNVRTRPSALLHAVATGGIIAAWLAVGTWAGVRALTAMRDTSDILDGFAYTAVVPYLLITVAAAVVWSVRATPGQTTAANAGLAACLAGGVAIAWASGFSLGGVLLGVQLLGLCAVPMAVRRLRAAVRLRAATLSAIKDYNAFGPAGARPRADRHTGAVLRELLARLPAARLFVRVPAGGLRVEYTVTCGGRVAVIGHPRPRGPHDTGADTLPDAVTDLAALLTGATVRGFVVWSHLPPDHAGGVAGVRHLTAPDAATEIGRWLAAEPYTLHLPSIRRLRDRLASGTVRPAGAPPAEAAGDRTGDDAVAVR